MKCYHLSFFTMYLYLSVSLQLHPTKLWPQLKPWVKTECSDAFIFNHKFTKANCLNQALINNMLRCTDDMLTELLVVHNMFQLCLQPLDSSPQSKEKSSEYLEVCSYVGIWHCSFILNFTRPRVSILLVMVVKTGLCLLKPSSHHFIWMCGYIWPIYLVSLVNSGSDT